MHHSMKLKFTKTCKEAVTPTYANPGDAGLDLTAVSVCWSVQLGYVEYETGIAVEIPEGYVGLLFPRSSISKYELVLCNSVGVIDSGYRGTIKLRFRSTNGENPVRYTPGNKVGQLVIVPYAKVELEQVEELSDTERGSGGFGRSGG